MRFSVVTVVLLIVCCGLSHAQHLVDFNASATACRNEFIAFENLSDTPATVDWTFCASELNGTYTSIPFGNISTFLTSIEVVEDNGAWYGFATSRGNELFRLSFGSDPFNSNYTLTSLGNPGSLLDTPDGISIVKDGAEWYGLVTNLSSEIIRLRWTSLTAAPTAVSLGLNATGKLSQPSQVEIRKDNGEFIALVANGGSSKLTMINFHGSMSTMPTGADVIESVVFPGAGNMYGVSATRQCNQWEIYTVADNKIYRAVTTSLFSAITVGQIQDFTSSIPFSIGSFNRIRTTKYFDRVYFYFTSFTAGYVAGASWQTGAPAPEMVNMGTIAVPPLPYSLALFRNGDSYGLLAGGFNAGAMRGIQMGSTCGASKRKGTEFRPTDVSYPAAGNYRVGLNMTYADGQTCSKSQDIVIQPADAPSFDFSFDNICKNSTTTFTIASPQTLTAVWEYGDGGSDNTGVHSYTTAGTFEASVEVTAPNTCKNRRFKDIKIYEPPVAAFQSPAGLVCTNNEFTFINNTPDVFDGKLMYEWQVDNVVAGTTRDLRHTFTTLADKSIKLTTSLPGCSDDDVQLITGLLPGPTVGFTATGKCATEEVDFVNSSTGDISGYHWAFGDGDVSTDTSPGHTYANIGHFIATLQTTANNGCVSTTSKTIDIFSLPAPAFSLDLPPFSCANSPSQFHDATPPPTDSNVNQWNWTFGDTQSGTGEDPTHVYSTAGTYNVRLSVATDKGCTAFKDQEVTISPSPTASFLSDPTCLNKPAQFTSTSTGDIKSWRWRIGTQIYTVENPVHQFGATGNFSVQLTVTGNNDCVNVITKPVVIPVAPVLDFNVTNACSGQAAVFNDITSSSTDPITQRLWTFNGSGTATTQQASFNFATAGTYPVKLDITNQSGCVYSLTRPVVINPSPVANFTMSEETGPPPFRVTFTNTSTGATSYQWNFNDGFPVVTEQSPEYTFPNLGDQDVTLTATSASGCSATQTKTVSVVIPHNELTLELFSFHPSPAGHRPFIRVHNKGNYRIDGFDVTFDVGGGFLVTEKVVTSLRAGETSTILLSNTFSSPGPSGYICAELQSDTNLSDNKACAVLTDISVVLTPYPNPADSYLTVETIQPRAGTVRIRLYSSTGGAAYDRSFDVEEGLSRLSLDLQNLSPGMYVLVVSAGSTTTSRHILVAR